MFTPLCWRLSNNIKSASRDPMIWEGEGMIKLNFGGRHTQDSPGSYLILQQFIMDLFKVLWFPICYYLLPIPMCRPNLKSKWNTSM
jgi:hypothetical protein